MKRSLLQALFTVLLLTSAINASAQSTIVVEEGAPTLDGVASEGEWPAALVTQRGVSLSALADGSFLYILASWEDDDEDILKNRMVYNGSRWAKAEDEDRIAFLFDMGQTGNDGANCQAFCHFPSMNTNGGVVDVWQWKAASTNPMGYSEDTYWDAVGQQIDEGVTASLLNDLTASQLPTFMAATDPGAMADFLAENADALNAFDPYGTQDAHTVAEAVDYDDSATFTTDAQVPGYLLRVPSGDVADVQTAGKYSDGKWTVEFKRKYDGGDHDFTVVPGASVKFMHETFDNQGGDHAIDATPIDTTIYTLDFSNITLTSVDPISSTLPASFSVQQNYPNPFNPSTMIEFNIPQQSFVNLKVVNLLGQEVSTLVNEDVMPGQYRIDFNASNLPSGVYFYTLTTESFSQTRQMTLLR